MYLDCLRVYRGNMWTMNIKQLLLCKMFASTLYIALLYVRQLLCASSHLYTAIYNLELGKRNQTKLYVRFESCSIPEEICPRRRSDILTRIVWSYCATVRVRQGCLCGRVSQVASVELSGQAVGFAGWTVGIDIKPRYKGDSHKGDSVDI